jgi:hypothetical protein
MQVHIGGRRPLTKLSVKVGACLRPITGAAVARPHDARRLSLPSAGGRRPTLAASADVCHAGTAVSTPVNEAETDGLKTIREDSGYCYQACR